VLVAVPALLGTAEPFGFGPTLEAATDVCGSLLLQEAAMVLRRPPLGGRALRPARLGATLRIAVPALELPRLPLKSRAEFHSPPSI